MRLKVNELWFDDIQSGATVEDIKNKFKNDADVVILNGFPINENKILKNEDRIVFIKKGEMPNEEQLEALMMSRHTPGVHERVKGARIGIAGAGGLGSNIAISLARIGVGFIKIVDFDVVEPSNLNRQQYYVNDIGKYKVEALKENIQRINPFINVEARKQRIEKENIEETFKDVDIIIEAFDNAEYKAMLSNYVLINMRGKVLIASSGMAGYFSSNSITTKKVSENFYICGDFVNEAREGSGLMAPRVAVCANHMANMALRIILDRMES